MKTNRKDRIFTPKRLEGLIFFDGLLSLTFCVVLSATAFKRPIRQPPLQLLLHTPKALIDPIRTALGFSSIFQGNVAF